MLENFTLNAVSAAAVEHKFNTCKLLLAIGTQNIIFNRIFTKYLTRNVDVDNKESGHSINVACISARLVLLLVTVMLGQTINLLMQLYRLKLGARPCRWYLS